MSGENLSSTTPPPAPSIFTIYPGFRENVNYGFQSFHPDDPPPKYEDVISGEYLKSNHPGYNYSQIPTAAPAYQSVDLSTYSTRAHANTTQSEHSLDENGPPAD